MLFAAAPLAHAQEAPPIPIGLGLSPDTGLPVLIRARDAGLLVAGSDGRFRLICAGALGVSSNADFFLHGRANGGLLITNYTGLSHSDASACEWTYPDPALENVNVADLDRVGDTLYLLIARDNLYSVYRSDDGGETFAELFALPEDAAFFRVRVAPSEPDRFYLTGVTTDADAGVVERWLYRTDDAGSSFSRTELELDDGPIVELLGVARDDPQRVYMAFATRLSSHSHGEEPETMDRLVVTEDDGRTLTTLRELHLFGGFAFGAASGELWLGDAEGGLLRSTNAGESFSAVDDALHVSCIERNGDRLWVCADSVQDPFSVGFTDDEGGSFEPFMRFDEVAGIQECDGAPLMCAPQWRGWQFWHAPDGMATQGPGHAMDDGGIPGHADAAPPTTVASEDSRGGCSCGVAASRGPGSLLPLALALAWLRRRRRPA